MWVVGDRRAVSLHVKVAYLKLAVNLKSALLQSVAFLVLAIASRSRLFVELLRRGWSSIPRI